MDRFRDCDIEQEGERCPRVGEDERVHRRAQVIAADAARRPPDQSA
jgi:hypothetical protein